MSAGATTLSSTPVGGNSPESQLLKLLGDPVLLAKRVELYKKVREDADAAVALVGPANDIARLREDAVQRVERATAEAEALKGNAAKEAEALKQAAAAIKAEATAVLDAAKTEAQRLSEEAAANHAAAAGTKSDADAYAASIKSQWNAVLVEANKALADANDAKKAATDAAAFHQAASDKLAAKLAKLKALSVED